MKKLLVILVIVFFSSTAIAAMGGLEGHKAYIYPVVRISTNMGTGSGTVIYSKLNNTKYSTYILTNFHVISEAISIDEEWNSDLGKNEKVERRGLVYVEIFKYRDISIPVGTMRVEADIITYNKTEDIALLKLRYEDEIKNVAKLPSIDKLEEYKVMDESIAVGCSLAFPPLPTVGIITRINLQLDSLPYNMSSSQVIYGNSGGAMFTSDGLLIGIPSKVATAGWGTPIPHMGLFIPISRIEKWLNDQHLNFIFDTSKNEKECLAMRNKLIKEKKEK